MPHEPVPPPFDPSAFPHTARYWAQKGHLPAWAEVWGNTRPLTNGTGWAARLYAAAPHLEAVTLRLTPATAQGLEIVPDDRVLSVVNQIVQGSELRPRLGAIRPEWSTKAGWHFHGIVSDHDAERIQHLPAHLGDIKLTPVRNIQEYRRTLGYMTKVIRRDVPLVDRVHHAERLLSIRAALGVRALPPMTQIYGV